MIKFFRDIGNYLFKIRSYTPLPFLIIMVLFAEPTFHSILIGILVALSGETIRLWAVSYAGSETRTTSDVGGSTLVTQGPYGYVRNPLYIGNILIYLGIGIMSNSLFPYLQIFALIYFTFQYYCIILSEEEYLMNTFSYKYKMYFNSVNRFLPSGNNIPKEIKSDLNFQVDEGLKSERRTLQALAISFAIILIIYFSDIKILAS